MEPTAHHTKDWRNATGWMAENGLVGHQQRRVWVPFHFLPGGEGESYLARMICRKDSEIAREMVEHHLGKSDKRYYLPLLGIMAHVYGDTFSHYGFSGMASRENEVKSSSIRYLNRDLPERIREHLRTSGEDFEGNFGGEAKGLSSLLEEWKAEVVSEIVEHATGGLGHAGVMTYPDRPYLVWEFEYEDQSEGGRKGRKHRDNPTTFHEGARSLHKAFSKAPPRLGRSKTSPKHWRDISEHIRKVIETPGLKAERIASWQSLMESGLLGGEKGETIAVYTPEGKEWNAARKRLSEKTSEEALDEPVYQFYQAAALHRVYVLRDLLPEHGLLGD